TCAETVARRAKKGRPINVARRIHAHTAQQSKNAFMAHHPLLIGLIADVDVAVWIYGILSVVVSCTPTSFIVEDHEIDFQVSLVNFFQCQAPLDESLDPWVMVLEIDLHCIVWQ